MHSLRIVQWNSTRRDNPGNPGGVSGSGPVICITILEVFGVRKKRAHFIQIGCNFNFELHPCPKKSSIVHVA